MDIVKTDSSVLETFDNWQAAYFLAVGVPLLRVSRTKGQFTRYLFDNADGIAETALLEWHRGQAFVPARKYAAAFRECKRLGFEAERAA